MRLKWNFIISIVFDAVFALMTAIAKASNLPDIIFPWFRSASVKGMMHV